MDRPLPSSHKAADSRSMLPASTASRPSRCGEPSIDSLPDELLARILSFALSSSGGTSGSSVSGVGLVSKRWLQLIPTFHIDPVLIRPYRITPVYRVHNPNVARDAEGLGLTLSVPSLSAHSLFRSLSLAPSVTSVSLGRYALDFYDRAFLASLFAAGPKLTHLNLSEPRFTGAPHFRIGPKSLDRFLRGAAASRLQKLTLSHCLDHIAKLPGSIASLTSLRVLELHSKALCSLPAEIFQLHALQDLRLGCPALESLPETFGQLQSLSHVSFSACGTLEHLPEAFTTLSSLTSLHIDGPWQAGRIPSTIGAQLRRLELRDLDGKLLCDDEGGLHGEMAEEGEGHPYDERMGGGEGEVTGYLAAQQARGCREWVRLEEVTLDSCRNLQCFQPTALHSLTCLTITGDCTPDAIPRTLPGPVIRHLFDLPVLPPAVTAASSLRHLTITCQGLRRDLPLHSLALLSSLERLEVSCADQRESFPEALFALPRLSFVSLGGVSWVLAVRKEETAAREEWGGRVLEWDEDFGDWSFKSEYGSRRLEAGSQEELAERQGEMVERQAQLAESLEVLVERQEQEAERQRQMAEGQEQMEYQAKPYPSEAAAAAIAVRAAAARARAVITTARDIALSTPAAPHPPLGPSLQHLDLQVTISDYLDGYYRLPSLIGSLRSLTHLTISNLDSSVRLPPTIGLLLNLRSLSLLAHSLTSLSLTTRSISRVDQCLRCPPFLTHLTSLTHLHMVGLTIPSPTSSLTRLSSLRTLRIDSASLVALPANLGQLAALEWLELGQSSLYVGVLPSSLCGLSSLRRLHLRSSRLKELPEAIHQLSRLEELVFHGCKLRFAESHHLPPGFGRLGALKKLSVHGVTSLPDTLGGLTSLEEAAFSGCEKLCELPPSFCLLSRLHTLTITRCGDLLTLPTNFGSLTSLKSLAIDSCEKFHHLPDSFSSLASLIHLTITNCPKLSTLPDGFGSLPKLARLKIVECNSFSHLPASFPSLPSLRVACFSLCQQLSSLPEDIGMLPRLEVLQLRQCMALKSLPCSLGGARALRHMDVYGSGLERGVVVGVSGKTVHVVSGECGEVESVGSRVRWRRGGAAE